MKDAEREDLRNLCRGFEDAKGRASLTYEQAACILKLLDENAAFSTRLGELAESRSEIIDQRNALYAEVTRLKR